MNFLCKYCKKVIMVALHYRNIDRITFVTTSTMTTNFQQSKYCKLGIKKMGHAHSWCLHVKITILLVNLVLILLIYSGLKHACGVWHSMIGQKDCKLGNKNLWKITKLYKKWTLYKNVGEIQKFPTTS